MDLKSLKIINITTHIVEKLYRRSNAINGNKNRIDDIQ